MKGFLLNLLNTNHENQTPESWPGALQCDDGIPGRRAGHQEDAGAPPLPPIFSSVRGSGTITESDNTVLTVPLLDFLEHCLSLGEAS